MGGASSLYVDGDVRKTPWYLVAAVQHVLMILSFNELPKSDRPSREIWCDDEALAAHFERVSDRYASGSSDYSSEDLEQNEYTRDLKKKG